MRKWRRDQLVPFVEWYWRDARVGIVREHGKIVGVALARLVNSPEEAEEPYRHDPEGKIMWVQDIVSKHADAIGTLIGIAAKRFGERTAIAGTLINRRGERFLLPWKFIERFTRGNCHGIN